MEKIINKQEKRKERLVFSNITSLMNKSVSENLEYFIPEIHKRAASLIEQSNRLIAESKIILNTK